MNWIRDHLFSRTAQSLAILVFAACIMVAPMLVNGIPTGNDFPHHYRFALEISENLSHGAVDQTWNDSANYGFGDVGIRFYPPLSYLPMIAFDAMVGDWYFASIFAFFLWFLLGGIGVYAWSREWFDETSSVVAAVVYMVMPYHANQIYNAFLYAEFAAAAVVPFCFLFATRVSRNPSAKNTIFLAASYTALVLTHLPTALIASAGLVVYSVLSFPKSERIRCALSFGSAIVIGLLGASFYLVRVFTETEFLKHAMPEFTSGAFSFDSNFLLSYFYAGSDDYFNRSVWFADLILALTLLASIPSAVLYLRSRATVERRNIIAVAAVLATSVFFATPASSLLWTYLPLLAKIQFPFRWLTLVTLMATIFIAAGFRQIVELSRTAMRPLAIVMLGSMLFMVAFTAFQIVRPARSIDRLGFDASLAALDTSPSCECWWPIWAKGTAFDNRQPVTAVGRIFTIESWYGTERSFRSASGPGGVARVALFYYPNWTASINGAASVANVADDGTTLIELPDGPAEVRLILRESFAANIFRVISISLFALFASCCLFWLVTTIFTKRISPEII